jgi:hypothetical protein
MQRLLGISQSLKQERRWHDLTSQYNLDEALGIGVVGARHGLPLANWQIGAGASLFAAVAALPFLSPSKKKELIKEAELPKDDVNLNGKTEEINSEIENLSLNQESAINTDNKPGLSDEEFNALFEQIKNFEPADLKFVDLN